ncbi:MAG TPA: porin [Candidatus Sulfotelmatobacter sp.]|jgi:hypothetical protein|nr:porin [Candidatus Sulfotelmatobacter sp.]
MKKVLLASAALLAFGTAAQAAEPVKLSIGGYAIENLGYATNKSLENKTTTDVQSDVVVTFTGKTALDNGITVGVNVETFGSQRKDSRTVNGNCGNTGITGTANCGGNGNIKRSYVTVGSAFGTAIVGEREDVGYIVHNSAPNVGPVGAADGTWWQWVAPPSAHRAYTSTDASRYDDRTNKFTYVSPSFYGLAAAFTYAPNISMTQAGHTTITSNSDSATFAPTGTVIGADFGGDLYVGGLAFANTFGDVSVKADFGVGQANIANLRVFQGGTQVSYAGFTVGGSIFNRNVANDATVTTGSGSTLTGYHGATAQALAYAGQSWDAGVSYATGPYSVSLAFFHDTSKDSGALGSSHSYAADSTDVWSLGAAYVAGPGVTFRASVSTVDYKDGSDVGAAANKNNGVVAVTGIKVDF